MSVAETCLVVRGVQPHNCSISNLSALVERVREALRKADGAEVGKVEGTKKFCYSYILCGRMAIALWGVGTLGKAVVLELDEVLCSGSYTVSDLAHVEACTAIWAGGQRQRAHSDSLDLAGPLYSRFWKWLRGARDDVCTAIRNAGKYLHTSHRTHTALSSPASRARLSYSVHNTAEEVCTRSSSQSSLTQLTSHENCPKSARTSELDSTEQPTLKQMESSEAGESRMKNIGTGNDGVWNSGAKDNGARESSRRDSGSGRPVSLTFTPSSLPDRPQFSTASSAAPSIAYSPPSSPPPATGSTSLSALASVLSNISPLSPTPLSRTILSPSFPPQATASTSLPTTPILPIISLFSDVRDPLVILHSILNSMKESRLGSSGDRRVVPKASGEDGGSKEVVEIVLDLVENKKEIYDALARWKRKGTFSLRRAGEGIIQGWELGLILPLLATSVCRKLDLRNCRLRTIPLELALLDEKSVQKVLLDCTNLEGEEKLIGETGDGKTIVQYARALKRGGHILLRQRRLVLVGAPAVGKSSLVRALSGASFAPNLLSTDGIDIGSATLYGITMRTWDFAGQHVYRCGFRAILVIIL